MEVIEMLERLPAIADAIQRSRAMAVEPSELGFMVAVHDGDDRVRLRVWPPHR